MVEPCVNPALERQAIGRVHRMGQKRVVKVWRLVMKDSIDEKIIQVTKRITDGGRYDEKGTAAVSEAGAAGAGGAAKKRRGDSMTWEQRAKLADEKDSQVGGISRDSAASMKLEELDILFS
jgi:hypothetical protein